MIISKRLEDAEFIMSKDELTYSAVIEDFKNASQIHILTYNISKDQNVLLKALKDCEKDTEICIVSNIPGRWESYFGKTYADKAKRNISLYKSKLSPQKIAEKAEVYFCFSNHAKIIMTDNIAYVGSSNFSEESADNFESGFISRDVDFIEFLQEEVFPWIIASSSEYKTDEELLFLETAIRKSIAMFGAMHEEYYQMFYLLSDHRGIENWYYNTTSSVLNTRELEKTKEICYQYLELHHFTTLQMISLSANQPFYGIHQPCRFYSCFDVFDETDVKYLFLNFLADEKTEVLYAFTAVCGKIFFLIRQQFHCAVADIDQVD